MKKLLLVAAFGVAGLMNANNFVENMAYVDLNETDNCDVVESKSLFKRCVGVESSCGEAGFACAPDDELTLEGEVPWEYISEFQMLLEETFCN